MKSSPETKKKREEKTTSEILLMNENICPQNTIPTVPVDILRVGLNFFLNLKREFEVCYHENTERSCTEVSSCYEMNNGNA